eukprot:scaffold202413_cov26-Prasinocladus_malaysianus.AAC.1
MYSEFDLQTSDEFDWNAHIFAPMRAHRCRMAPRLLASVRWRRSSDPVARHCCRILGGTDTVQTKTTVPHPALAKLLTTSLQPCNSKATTRTIDDLYL